MRIVQSTATSFVAPKSFVGRPRWKVENSQLIAAIFDQDHDFEIRIDVQDLRHLAATPGGFTFGHAIEKLIASN